MTRWTLLALYYKQRYNIATELNRRLKLSISLIMTSQIIQSKYGGRDYQGEKYAQGKRVFCREESCGRKRLHPKK